MTDKFSELAWETYLNVAPWPKHEGLVVANVKAAFLAGAVLHANELASLRRPAAAGRGA